MSATFSPAVWTSPLELPVESVLTFYISADGDNAQGVYVTNLVISDNINYSGITLTNGATSASALGTFGIDLFGASVEHVSKGSSDLIETSVTDSILEVPDNKELIEVTIPEISSIAYTITATAYLNDGTNSSVNYEFIITNNYSKYADWITDYLENRY
jgi:hypothetical protein